MSLFGMNIGYTFGNAALPFLTDFWGFGMGGPIVSTFGRNTGLIWGGDDYASNISYAGGLLAEQGETMGYLQEGWIARRYRFGYWVPIFDFVPMPFKIYDPNPVSNA